MEARGLSQAEPIKAGGGVVCVCRGGHPLANHESFSHPSLLQDGPLHVPADPPHKCVSALEQRHLQLKVTAGFFSSHN